MGKNANLIRDHVNLEDKVWYGTDILISRRLRDNAPLPGPIRCSMLSLVACLKGTITYKLNLKLMHWVAPSVTLITPDSVLEHCDTSPDSEGCVIAVSSDFLKRLQIYSTYQSFASITSKPIMQLNQNDLDNFHLYFDLVYKLVHSPKTPLNDKLVLDVLQSFFNYFLHRYEELELHKEQEEFKSRGEYVCSEFMKLANEYSVDRKDIGFYADKLSLSEKYLSNVVKRVTGKSPTLWIRWIVVQKATSLLFDLSKSIQQISDELNFATPSHFTAYFKKELGCTPKQYRKSLGM